jgi:peptide/nickel transport system ATP-binding protein
MREHLLSVRDLYVHFPPPQEGDGAVVRAVDGVSFDLAAGEALAIVGESGSGKTSLGRALLGLHPPGIARGSIRLEGRELSGLSEEKWRPLRWRRLAMTVQGVGTAFDPVYRIGEQIAEPLREHFTLSVEAAAARVRELAEQVGLEQRHLRAYPHQLSGGEKQRAMLAMALSCHPDVLIVDEPTSGQDALSRARLIDLLRELRGETSLSLLLITHDLAAAAQLADRVAVLYAGKLLEVGTNRDVLERPRHPYTWGLLNAYPSMTTARDLRGIRGQSPDAADPPAGCRFHPRCTQAKEICRQVEPSLTEQDGRLIACHLGGLSILLQAWDLRKAFSTSGRGVSAAPDTTEEVEAVRRASLQVYHGEVLALVGETGSGKTTLGRLLVGLLRADGGRVVFEGQDLATMSKQSRKALRQRIQFISQDPFDAVSPRLCVAEIVREPLDIQGIGPANECRGKVIGVLRAVGLSPDAALLRRRAHELSGGQLQRVAIARALVLDPKLIVADEPVSMLDASEQAKVINLLKEIQNERGMGLLIISHDLALVRKVADRILVMRQGEIVEEGPASQIVSQPRHQYTRALLGAAPSFGWQQG